MCHKNHMTSHVTTLLRVHVNLTMSFQQYFFIMKKNEKKKKKVFSLNAIKSHFKGSYDKQNLTLMVISYEIYVTCYKLVS